MKSSSRAFGSAVLMINTAVLRTYRHLASAEGEELALAMLNSVSNPVPAPRGTALSQYAKTVTNGR
jgi:hypothetical protein